MTRYKICLDGHGNGLCSHFTRTLEAATLQCAMQQAKQDLEMAQKTFSNMNWHVYTIEEIEATTK